MDNPIAKQKALELLKQAIDLMQGDRLKTLVKPDAPLEGSPEEEALESPDVESAEDAGPLDDKLRLLKLKAKVG